MAENEPIAKRLSDQHAKLKSRGAAITDPKNADRALILETLALLSEGVARINREVNDLKKGSGKGPGAKPKPAGENAKSAEGGPTAKPAGAKPAGAKPKIGPGGKPKGPGLKK